MQISSNHSRNVDSNFNPLYRYVTQVHNVTDNFKKFTDSAATLSRNPLGIIALFIILVYGVAALTTISSSTLDSSERLPLIYFLITFPFVVLGVFGWLVSRHSSKLFAPQDFRDESNYVQMQLLAVASLTAAAAKDPQDSNKLSLETIVRSVRTLPATEAERGQKWRRQILWVDDRPENNVYERRAFEAVGMEFSLALTTTEALEQCEKRRFGAIISDMGRKEGPREGYVLLDELRAQGNTTPFFVYASSDSPEHKREVLSHGGQGNTNAPNVLFQMVTEAVLSR